MSQELKIIFGPKLIDMFIVMFYHQSMMKSMMERMLDRLNVHLFFECEGQAAFSILPDKIIWYKDGSWEVSGLTLGGEEKTKISASFLDYETRCQGTVTVGN